MLLNRIEKAMMNNPFRAMLQTWFEAPRLLQMGGVMQGGEALEVGCGRGVGTGLILDLFKVAHVDAFDLDPEMVKLAQSRWMQENGRIRIWNGDVTQIQANDNTYDAVFDFGIIHHVPVWRDAIKEIYRVLKPGGRFYAEEVLDRFILHPIWRRVLKHPMEDRFDHDAFVAALRHQGFSIVSTQKMWHHFAWFVSEKTN